MWNYVKLCPNESPMAQILSRCSNKANISLVIYHLEENHVECATVPLDMVERFKLGNVADMIAKDAEGGDHAILAYDVCAKGLSCGCRTRVADCISSLAVCGY